MPSFASGGFIIPLSSFVKAIVCPFYGSPIPGKPIKVLLCRRVNSIHTLRYRIHTYITLQNTYITENSSGLSLKTEYIHTYITQLQASLLLFSFLDKRGPEKINYLLESPSEEKKRWGTTMSSSLSFLPNPMSSSISHSSSSSFTTTTTTFFSEKLSLPKLSKSSFSTPLLTSRRICSIDLHYTRSTQRRPFVVSLSASSSSPSKTKDITG